MKIPLLILTVFYATCFSANAQIDDFQAQLISYLNINGTRIQFTNVYEEVFSAMQQQFAEAEVEEADWAELRMDKDEQIDEVISLLTFAYRKYFTPEDIEGMQQFILSEARQQGLTDPSALTEEQKNAIIAFRSGPIGQKMAETHEDLTEIIVQIYQSWSQDLYSGYRETLTEKGYKIEH